MKFVLIGPVVSEKRFEEYGQQTEPTLYQHFDRA